MCSYLWLGRLVFGVDILDLNFWVQINHVKQPIQRNSVGSGNVSHCRTSIDLQLSFWPRLRCLQKCTASHQVEKISRSTKHDEHYSDQDCRAGLEPWFLFWVCLFDVVLREEFLRTWSLVLLDWFGEKWNTSITKCQRSRAGMPSIREPATREIISASVELWNWSLFLAPPIYWHERLTSEYAQDTSWCWFWVF